MNVSSLLTVPEKTIAPITHLPPPDMMWTLWKGYVENAGVLVKIVYKPAIEALVKDMIIEPHNIDSGVEALLFAVCFATATALSAGECLR